jgi:hypothetical protein
MRLTMGGNALNHYVSRFCSLSGITIFSVLRISNYGHNSISSVPVNLLDIQEAGNI